jgi:phage recombination protein Bet
MTTTYTQQDSPETALAVIPQAQLPTFGREQLDLIKRTVANGTSDDEFALFIEVCKRTGLDPFSHQIYAIMRNTKVGSQWVKRMTIQTGIDGYRALAARTGLLAGIDDAIYDTEDGEHPRWARVTIYRWSQGQRCAFTATARWAEYAQYTTKDGLRVVTGKWGDMPWLMLGKCAEALALRKAFPVEISGVYTAEEMMQADSTSVESTPTQQRQIAEPSTRGASNTTVAGRATMRSWQKLRWRAIPYFPSADDWERACVAHTHKNDVRAYTNGDYDLMESVIANLEAASVERSTGGDDDVEVDG